MADLVSSLNTLVGYFVPSAAADVVGVYDKDFKQVFQRARPVKALVKEESKLMEHPLETGATIVDHRIILPVEIELSLLLQASDYRDTYQEIKQLYLNAEILTVQTRSGTYSNQIIMSMPHDEDPERFECLAVALKLKEAMFVTPEEGELAPKDKTKSSTADKGNVQGSEADATKKEKSTSSLGQWLGKAA